VRGRKFSVEKVGRNRQILATVGGANAPWFHHIDIGADTVATHQTFDSANTSALSMWHIHTRAAKRVAMIGTLSTNSIRADCQRAHAGRIHDSSRQVCQNPEKLAERGRPYMTISAGSGSIHQSLERSKLRFSMLPLCFLLAACSMPLEEMPGLTIKSAGPVESHSRTQDRRG
jgi:hypothetical protein